MAKYNIHKGVGKNVEFKGLTAQYLYLFGGGLLGVIIVVFIFYALGINQLFCLLFGVITAPVLVLLAFWLNRKYGQYGLMKLSARRNRPHYLSHRKPIHKILRNKV